MSFLYYSLLLLFVVLSFFLVLLVLIQKGRGGGLSAAFGGVGGNTAFGAKTGDVLTWATSIVFGVFLLLAIGLNLIANNVHAKSSAVLVDTPAASPTTVPTDAAKDVVNKSDIAVPAATPTAPNPTPTPPPTPTTNPSTNPSAVTATPSEATAVKAIAPAATQPAK